MQLVVSGPLIHSYICVIVLTCKNIFARTGTFTSMHYKKNSSELYEVIIITNKFTPQCTTYTYLVNMWVESDIFFFLTLFLKRY